MNQLPDDPPTPMPGDVEPADVFWLDRPDQIDILADSTRLEILELLFAARSVAELAERMGVPRTRLYHHVNLLADAGMIRVVDTRQVGAVAEKVYRVAARTFQPSESYLEAAPPREMAQAMMASILGATEADFVRSVEDGAISFEDQDSERSVHIRRGLMFLDRNRLHEFIRELEAVYERYDIDELSQPLPDDVSVVGTLSLVYPSSRRIR